MDIEQKEYKRKCGVEVLFTVVEHHDTAHLPFEPWNVVGRHVQILQPLLLDQLDVHRRDSKRKEQVVRLLQRHGQMVKKEDKQAHQLDWLHKRRLRAVAR